mgnify:CR=1 FL=1
MIKMVLFEIAEQEGFQLKHFTRLTGGDINAVFLLETPSEKLVIKLNDKQQFPAMFQKEAFALQELKETKSFRIPKVRHLGEIENQAYLILEYIVSGTENKQFWEDFGLQLANLHKHTNENFGWENQNYIGSLPQYNEHCESSSAFYISQRLQPQLKLAKQNGFRFQDLDCFLKNVSELIPKNEKPALIHGDLWSGNYMVDADQSPVLIDPAIAYASREMDLAMMQLFGGFPTEVFETYQANFPLPDNWQNRIELYQLYYLLVHLNLFGQSYLSSVQRIIKKYS